MIRRLARLLREVARDLPDPDEDPDLGPFCTYLRQRYGRHPLALSPKEWEEGLLDLIAEAIAEGWTGTGPPARPGTPRGRGTSPAPRWARKPSSRGARRSGRLTGRPGGRGCGGFSGGERPLSAGGER